MNDEHVVSVIQHAASHNGQICLCLCLSEATTYNTFFPAFGLVQLCAEQIQDLIMLWKTTNIGRQGFDPQNYFTF